MMRALRRAMAGVIYAVAHERNMRIHICVAAYVVLFGLCAGLEGWAWAVCLVCFGLVLAAELQNTSIERLCDRVCPEYNELIRESKDAAAGGVLLAAFFSVLAGAAVFFRPEPLGRLWLLLAGCPWLVAVPLALMVPCVFFVKSVRRDKKEK